MLRNAKRIGVLSIAIVLGSSVLLTGCGSANSTGNASSAKKNAKFSGTITMYADQYGPSSSKKTTELTKLAQKYEKSHPGITIKFVQVPAGSNYDTWLRTEASGGKLPDIVYGLYTDINDSIAPGVLTKLNPFLNAPDPYVSGKTWAQDLNPLILSETAASDGTNYVINGDYVGQGMFYNKSDFSKAGIKQPPTTWTQFIADAKKLKSNGITPVYLDMSTNGEGEFTWFSRLLYTNLYANQYKSLEYTGTSTVNTEDEVIAIKKGVFSNKSARWMEFWKLMKQFYAYLEPNATGVTGGNTTDLAFRSFSTGQSAMYFGGSWTPAQLKSSNAKFAYGSFPDPVPTKGNIPYATKYNSADAVGGPGGQLQYGIATPKADSSMTTAKEKACVNWLEYITTPKNDSAIVNSLGVFVPTVVGSKPAPSLSSLANLSNEPLEATFGGTDLSPQELDTLFRDFQGYLVGQTTLNQFGNQAETAMTQAANQLIQKNHWNLSKYGVK